MKSAARHSRLSLLMFAVIVGLAAPLLAQASPHGQAAFKQLKSLAGEWKGVDEGTPIKVQYTVTGDGSALMLVEQPGDSSAMITMFTVDGDRLLATHYCSAHNQPQMAADVRGDLQSGITFSLVHVAGLKTPEDWHNAGLTVRQDDKDHLTHQWTYVYKGKTGARVFHFARAR